MGMNRTNKIVIGAARTDQYLPRLKNKRVAVLANHTSIVGKGRLIDMLLEKEVNIVKIFGPEHGFSGRADDVVPVADSMDARTGIPIVSLWGGEKGGDPERMNSLWEGYKKPDPKELYNT